jgi:hypothetical protein
MPPQWIMASLSKGLGRLSQDLLTSSTEYLILLHWHNIRSLWHSLFCSMADKDRHKECVAAPRVAMLSLSHIILACRSRIFMTAGQ